MSKVWFVDFPTHQYKEDVVKLAEDKGLSIIDSKFKGSFECDEEEKPPKLTRHKK